MKRGTESFRKRRREDSNFNDVLAQIQHSGRIYFVKSLPKRAIQTLKAQKTATLTLPSQFVQENGDKIEHWVILRAHSSCGRSARPLVVRLRVSARSSGAGKIRIDGGLYAAIAGNWLQEGDSLVFVPQEDARLEFEVYMFRGTREFPLFPDEGDSASTDEENNNNEDVHKFPLFPDKGDSVSTDEENNNNEDKHKQVFTYDIREDKAIALQYANDYLEPHPGFYKQLTASNIGRSDRHLLSNSGQFEFPNDFMKTHCKHEWASVKFQGIHEDSPIHVITCRRRWSANRLRVHLLVTEWSRFVTENDLQKGHTLQFSLVADSYFVVRKV